MNRVECGLLLCALAACQAGDDTAARAGLRAPALEAATPPSARKLFMDVHHVGAGAIRAGDVAEAHQKDLAVEGRYGVDYREYWVDEGSGTIYCLVEAPDAALAHTVHKEAHGLLADELVEVAAGEAGAAPRGGSLKLFMCTDRGHAPGVDAAEVARQQERLRQLQDRYGVNVLRQWYGPKTGRIQYLAEAGSRRALVECFAEAGVRPDVVHQVERGR